MATDGGTAVSRCPGDSPLDCEEAVSGEESSLHERLVAYVHTLAYGTRRGVWGEHSYARAGAGAGAGGCAGRVRTLLAPRGARSPPALLDVERAPSPGAAPPGEGAPPAPSSDDDTDASEGEWEDAAVGSGADAQLVHAVAAAIAHVRATKGGDTRAAARRLRHALAPHWTSAAPGVLHAALGRHLPRADRRAYERLVAALWRSVPRLAARLTGAGAPPPAVPPPGGGAGPPVGPDSSPWLVWVSSGCAALDARWEPRLAALVHTRVLRGAGGAPGQDAAPPEPWCAAAAAAVRSALTDALAEAGSRAVILGGAGCGGAVALVLARGAGGAGGAEGGVRGLVVAAPPLSTAEGGREARDDALAACRLPLLLVAGGAAAQCARHAALAVTQAARDRRLLEVRAADCELRLPPRLRKRLRLPQHALDAALAEEVVRWAVDTAEREEPPPAAERRRPPLPAVVREIDLTEEYAHLPPAAHLAPPAPPTNSRGSDIEGRVVSRVSGSTPLALVPPRRAAPTAGGGAPAAGGGAPAAGGAAPAVGGATGGTTLAAADIMQLPIVFADDEPAPPASPAPPPLTVTSGKPSKRGAGGGAGDAGDGGAVKFTRVILAKRGAGGAGAGGGASPAPARRLLLRRPVRLVPAARHAHT